MKKITFVMAIALSVVALSGFAGDTKPKAKTGKKCTMGSCCKKTTSKAALLKAKPAVKKVA